MKTLFLIISLIICFLTCGSHANDSIYKMGIPVISIDANTLAMGGVSVASSGRTSGVFYNPAFSVSAPEGVSLCAGVRADYLSESVMKKEMQTSSFLLKKPGFAASLNLGRIGVAGGYRKDLDMGYFSEFSIIKNGQRDTFKNKSEGGIGRWFFSSALKLTENLHAGLSLNRLCGEAEISSYSLYYKDYKNKDRKGRSFKGGFVEWGLFYEPAILPLSFSVLLSPGYTATEKYDRYKEEFVWAGRDWKKAAEVSKYGKRKIKMPYYAAAGVKYESPNYPGSILCASIRYDSWEDLRFTNDDLKINPYYRNAVIFAVAAEYRFPSDVIFRGGFSFEHCYGCSASDRVSFSLGAGINLADSLVLDMGVSVNKKTRRGPVSFSDEIKTVDETGIKSMISLQWSFFKERNKTLE